MYAAILSLTYKNAWSYTPIVEKQFLINNSSPPRHSPRKSKEVKNPLEIAGFLLPFVRRCNIRSGDVQENQGMFGQEAGFY
jgi:galactitol-specific phosphotransferase system IIC component